MKKGVNPLVALVLTVLLSVVAVALTLSVINPTLDRIKDSAIINEAIQNLELINSAIRQVASESNGSKRAINLIVTDGKYKVEDAFEWIYFEYETRSDFFLEGVSGNVKLEKSPLFIDFFNSYKENSNASPVWKGTCKVEDGEYSCENATSYYSYEKPIRNFRVSGIASDKSDIHGEIFTLPIIPEKLKIYLTLDEGFGNESYDYSLNKNNGKIYNSTFNCASPYQGCPEWVYGICGNALRLDGIDDYIKTPTINIGENFSVSGWLKLIGDQNPYPNFVSNKNSGLISDGFSIFVRNNEIVWESGNGTNGETKYSQPFSSISDKFTHVAVTYANGTIKFYLNGNQIGISSLSYTNFNKDSPLFFGTFADLNDDGFLKGVVDEIRIFNVSLNEEEIKTEYEMSSKKIVNQTGMFEITNAPRLYLVLANPFGHTHFDEIKIRGGERRVKLIIPFSKIDLTGNFIAGKGNYKVFVENIGINHTTNKPIIRLVFS